MLTAALNHASVHLTGTFPFLTSHGYKFINKFLYIQLTSDLTYDALLFGTIAGKTGLVLVACCLIIFITTLKKVIDRKFEIFWYVHKIYYLMIIATLFHGVGKIVSEPYTWKFLIVPGFIFVIEKFIALFRLFMFKSKIISIKLVDSDVVELITS